jgi:hypothetical protein
MIADIFGEDVSCCNPEIVPLLSSFYIVRFEVFMVVTMRNAVFWDVTPYTA